jgi:hypothetical protein
MPPSNRFIEPSIPTRANKPWSRVRKHWRTVRADHRGLLMSEPNCPKCNLPMRLMRVVPSMLPPETGVETRVFACVECATTISLTARKGVGTVPE